MAVAIGAKGIVSSLQTPRFCLADSSVLQHVGAQCIPDEPAACLKLATHFRLLPAQIVPPARKRAGWAAQAQTRWSHAPFDSIWDAASLHAYAAGA